MEAFAEYTSRYNANDPKIKLKIDHTYRVAELCEEIARSLLLTEEEVELAWLSGMLHDVGRFEQIKQYGTFSDADSVDHATLGADLLFKENLLSIFLEEALEDEALLILETSIRNHSRYKIEDGLNAKSVSFCNILRDADKIDIFRVNLDTPMEEIYNVTTEELKNASVTQEVKQCFLEKHAVLRSLKKTSIDHLVGHICLAFELVYPKSLLIMKEQGYLETLLDFQSKNQQTREWFSYMKENLPYEK